MTASEQLRQDAVARFNEQHPVGTPVRYWPGVRRGDGRESVTRTPAWLVGGHTPCVSVEGYPGGIALTHVQVQGVPEPAGVASGPSDGFSPEPALDGGGEECGARNLEGGRCWKPPDHLGDCAYVTERRVAVGDEPGIGGYFAEIAFFGRIEHTGYVTEVVLHGGQAAYHIDLPEKLWGGNPLAWREYAASAFFEKNPVTEESVRAAWVAGRERAERLKRQQEDWERQRSQPALPAGDDDGYGDDGPDDNDEEMAF